MLRAIVCLCSALLLAAGAHAQYGGWSLPWPERADADRPVLDMLDELAAPEVSGEDLASQVQAFNELWRKHLDERAAMADTLAAVAANFEQDGQFIKALVLYELLWTEFPTRQDAIGKIKRDRALADMPLDLSNPRSAFTSLQHSLLVYRLTSPTFGITDLDTPIYERRPIERHEWEAWKQEQEAMTDEERFAEFEKKWNASTERLGPPIVPACCRSALYPLLEKTVDVDFTDALLTDVLARLSADSGLPLVPAREVRERIADERLTIKLSNAPLKEVLRYVLRYKNLRYAPGSFSLFIGDIEQRPDEGFRTVVMEQEPIDHFPDDARTEFAKTEPSPMFFQQTDGSEETQDDAEGESDDPAGRAMGIIEMFLGGDPIPEDWFVRVEGGLRGVVTAPVGIVGQWCSMVSTAEIGRYYGRVLPLLRCLRRYPLPGPYVPRAEGYPKARYICYVQFRRQVQAIQALLDDREAVAGLLAADLLDVAGGKPDRYEPRFSPTVGPALAARLGLWFDGESYRFLLFDSEHDRQRWLDGEDWTDVPSDLDDYDWPTDEEWQKQLEEMNIDVDDPDDELEEMDIDADWAPDSLKQTDTEADQPADREE